MQELPQLGKLERKYRAELTVIGVQSPKYPAEGQVENLALAVQRYGIMHPVVNDPDFRLWNDFAVKAWPTLVFISPAGRVVGSHAGEIPFEDLDRLMAEMVSEYERDGSLERGVGPQVQSFAGSSAELSFPGSVLAAGQRLFIADSGHHRVLVCGLEGQIYEVVGGGEPGWVDGVPAESRFNNPQGMAWDASSSTLYVADAGNHSIRAVDVSTGTVSTIAGTGDQARRVRREGPAREISMSSPWDLVLKSNVLYIAVAGLHQIWALHLDRLTIGVWAGTGHEGLRDGTRTAAWLAQPTGLASSDTALFVSCAEAQTLRAIDFVTEEVTTLTGRGLFDFGDEDGPADVATMQHSQAATYYDGGIFVSDTYNHKIKRFDLGAKTLSVVAGSGLVGTLDGPANYARVSGPSGLSIAQGELYIADTNNHVVRRLHLQSRHLYTLDVRPI